MGKTAGNAVWLDPNKTSPYDFYQYWRNVGDADVLKCIRMLTFLPIDQINEMNCWEGSQLNKAKEILAFELISLVHGEEEAKKAEASAKELFGGIGGGNDLPSVSLKEEDLADGRIDILTLLVKSGLCESKSDARRNVQQGGVTVNNVKISKIDYEVTAGDISAGVLLRKGKKNYCRIIYN